MMICYPIRESEDDFDFWITKIEEWETKKIGMNTSTANLISLRYNIFLPGVTINDITESIPAETEIVEAIDILKETGLVKVKLVGAEIRYVITDNYLSDLISPLKQKFIHELYTLLYKWQFFELPTASERERMIWLFGNKFNQILSRWKSNCMSTR